MDSRDSGLKGSSNGERRSGSTKIRVRFNENENENICIERPNFISFHDFDHWARQRFCINSESHIAYYARRTGIKCDTTDTEVIPSGNMADIDELCVKLIERSNPKGSTTKHLCWKYLIMYTPFLLLVMFAWAISPRVMRADMNNPDFLTQLLDITGLNRKLRLFFIEGFIGFICWAVTNLFIRRYLNPETHASALERFAPDAFFGGIAAGVQSILKIVLNRNIHGV